jgi:hypothetical protein
MRDPRVSVVMPAYNVMATIDEAVAAALGQTCRDIEVMVVDDGSTDGTAEHVERRWASDVRLIRQEHQGAPAARNRGKSEALGEFLLFLDADSVPQPDLIARFLAALEDHPAVSYAYCDYSVRLTEGSVREPIMRSRPFDPDALRQGNYVDTVSLIRARDCPDWDPDIRSLQDWDLWLTLLDQGKSGVYVPGALFESIDRPESITRSWSLNHYAQALADVRSKHAATLLLVTPGDERRVWKGRTPARTVVRELPWLGETDHALALADHDYVAVADEPLLAAGIRAALRLLMYCNDACAVAVAPADLSASLHGEILGTAVTAPVGVSSGLIVLSAHAFAALDIPVPIAADRAVGEIAKRAADAGLLVLGISSHEWRS